MDGVQLRLKLMLNALDIPSDISSLENRILIQKSIFIAQEAGANLGYTYNWYVHGPYSPELTQDYYILNNDLLCGDTSFNKYALTSSLTVNIEEIKKVFEVPENVKLSKEKWLELVASILYWMKETHSQESTKKLLGVFKKESMGSYPAALAKIKNSGLFSV